MPTWPDGTEAIYGEEAPAPGASFTCPTCGLCTYHPDDIAARFCPCCGGPGHPKTCPHPRLSVGPVPPPPGGKSEWVQYETICRHGVMVQQTVRRPGTSIPERVVLDAIIANHHRMHDCGCLYEIAARYLSDIHGRPPGTP